MRTPSKPAITLDQAITNAERIDGALHAFNYRPTTYKATVHSGGALAGVPIAVKDLIDTADMPTTYGSKVFEGHQPAQDAWIVSKLRAAGAVIFGKTVTTEFAWRDPGATVNPWNPAHSPGGSSSGSAAAVGAGIVNIGLGTQTVGSIIRPASYCGVVGYKPTFGLIPTTGVHQLAASLDHLGFITSSVYWAAICHAIVVQGTDFDAARFNLQGLRPRKVGVYRSSQWAQVDTAVQQNFDAVLARLAAFGVACVEVDFESDIRDLNALTSDILAYEAHAAIAPDIAGKEALVGDYTRELMARGAAIDATRYAALLTELAQLRARRDALFNEVDVILSITSPTTALKGLQKTGDASFCAPATLLGLPAVTVPSGFSNDLLPFGVQLIGAGNKDWDMLLTAQWLSTILPALSAPSLLPPVN
jgi:Asp-tRNA(Asn)/Glu-tRNA(Gln) amidotransferase A subunit family amidase